MWIGINYTSTWLSKKEEDIIVVAGTAQVGAKAWDSEEYGSAS